MAEGYENHLINVKQLQINLESASVGGSFDKPKYYFQKLTDQAEGTKPNLISGNQWFVISLIVDPDGTGLYNGQIAFGFASDAIAMRHKYGTSTWGAWKKIE